MRESSLLLRKRSPDSPSVPGFAPETLGRSGGLNLYMVAAITPVFELS